MPITAGGMGRTSPRASGSEKISWRANGMEFPINETPRICAEALRRQLPFQATISRPRLPHTAERRFGKASPPFRLSFSRLSRVLAGKAAWLTI